MKRLLSFIVLLAMVFSLVACGDNENSNSILKNQSATLIDETIAFTRDIAQQLYTMQSAEGFSVVGTSYDKDKADYIEKVFNDIGLSNVRQEPVMLNTWNYSGLSMTTNCNCTDNTDFTFYKIGSYPMNYNYHHNFYRLYYADISANLASIETENNGVLLPYYEDDNELEERVNAILEYNPAFIITVHKTHNGKAYRVNTDLFKGVEIPIFSISDISLNSLLIYMKNERSKGYLDVELNGSSIVSDNLVESSFVIGEIKGKSDKVVYVTSHRDAIHNGYMSAAVSTAELCTIADNMLKSGYKPDYTIRFMVTTGQEWGLVGQGQNTGIYSYIENLSEKDRENIKSVIVLDGNYPISNTVYTETLVSDGLKEKVEEYNSEYFAKNDIRFINTVGEITNELKTEAEVWNDFDISVILSNESSYSQYYNNNTSADDNSQSIDEDYLSFVINYYQGLIEIMSKK